MLLLLLVVVGHCPTPIVQVGRHVGDQQGTASSLEDTIALTGLMGRWEGEGRGGEGEIQPNIPLTMEWSYKQHCE